MEIQGKVIAVMEPKSGVSARGEWKAQDYVIETHIAKQLFTDQFSDSTSSTLISSPLQTYIILLLPLMMYSFPNSESFSCSIVAVLLIIYRLSSFISIYMLNNTKEFNVTKEMKDAVNDEGYASELNLAQVYSGSNNYRIKQSNMRY